MIQQFTFLLFLASNKDINIMFGYLTLCVSYLSFAWSACHACAALRFQDECTNEARGIQCATNRGSLVYNSPFMGYLLCANLRVLLLLCCEERTTCIALPHQLVSSPRGTMYRPCRYFVSPYICNNSLACSFFPFLPTSPLLPDGTPSHHTTNVHYMHSIT